MTCNLRPVARYCRDRALIASQKPMRELCACSKGYWRTALARVTASVTTHAIRATSQGWWRAAVLACVGSGARLLGPANLASRIRPRSGPCRRVGRAVGVLPPHRGPLGGRDRGSVRLARNKNTKSKKPAPCSFHGMFSWSGRMLAPFHPLAPFQLLIGPFWLSWKLSPRNLQEFHDGDPQACSRRDRLYGECLTACADRERLCGSDQRHL